ncbi:TRAP transporter permease [Clostridium sp. CM028]|uniref:TRAP transporter permease n=1 Tax=Clostridium sp. CM028 TaxID=2851575 RepID=UPI001C6F35B4|nr:TRAP transporter permease [Clostridium sp. CM028]MBW9149455.1 TRAP transporter permease [Clostridium sp. CM028]WLC62191.1 TRAP transporter permease [Clostridium sp. CM028]
MINLSVIHYAYIIIILIITVIITLKKDIILLCILGIGVIGYIFTGDVLSAVQIIYKAVVVSGKEFIEIVVVIALVNSMSSSLHDLGADELIIKPIRKLMINKTMSFFILGITVTVTSWFIWPTPAIVFIGALMVPAAIESGLPPVWAAVVLCLFGNGVALSSDFVLQAAPSITAKTANLPNALGIIKECLPFWGIMSIVTIILAFILMKKDKTSKIMVDATIIETKKLIQNHSIGIKIMAIVTPLSFIIDIIFIKKFNFIGSDSTALIGGTAAIIMIISSIIHTDFRTSLGEVTKYIKSGFTFGINIFAPIIIIGAFFFLGSEGTAVDILGNGASGLLSDIGIYAASKIPLSKYSVIGIQTAVSTLLGLSGSGFAGLPLVGTLANTFSNTINIDKEKVAAFGQIITIWIGGGTIIPWSVVAAAGVCKVEPFDVARKNVIPVICGIVATVLLAMIIL